MAKHPDNLNRQSYGLLLTLYMLPGRIILWFRYVSAPKGKVFATSRQARSPIVTGFVSTLFWAFCVWFLLASNGVIG